jgi:hypothetical protein
MAGGKNKSRKLNRNTKWCEAYRNRSQREKNKAKRLLRHFKRFGYANASAVHCYNNLPVNTKPADLRTVPLELSKKRRAKNARGAVS